MGFFRDILYSGCRPQTVWRVQRPKTGLGPYQTSLHETRSGAEFPWLINVKWCHPKPQSDVALYDRYHKQDPDDVYGFCSLEEYIKWFHPKEWREKLDQHGFKLVEYDGADITHGEYQLIFNRKKSLKLAQYTPTHFDTEFGDYWEIR